MKTLRYAALAAGLSLTLGTTSLWAQGGGGASGSPSNNAPGTPTNNAGSPQPGGKPTGTGSMSSGSTPMKSDSMNKGSTDKGSMGNGSMDKGTSTKPAKAMRRSKASSAPSGGGSTPISG